TSRQTRACQTRAAPASRHGFPSAGPLRRPLRAALVESRRTARGRYSRFTSVVDQFRVLALLADLFLACPECDNFAHQERQCPRPGTRATEIDRRGASIDVV